MGSNPGSGRCPGEGHGNPLWYSCVENPTDRGAWRATVHGVIKSQTWLNDQHFHTVVQINWISGKTKKQNKTPRLREFLLSKGSWSCITFSHIPLVKSLSYSNGFAARKTGNAVQARQSHQSYGYCYWRREWIFFSRSICFCSVAQSCLILCDPMDCSAPGFPVLHNFPEFAQTDVHQVTDAIQPSYLLLSPSPAFNLLQHQGLFQWVDSLHQVAKVLEFQLQHQSFQGICRVDFL